MQAIRNMEPAWEKVNGLKFQLKQRTISQHGRKYMGANLRSSKEPSASMGESTWAEISADIENHQSAWEKISGLKFQLSTYKDPTGRTLPCYTISEVAMMLNTQISQIFLDDHG